MGNIHETAIIDADVELGDNVSIGPYCVIGAGVSIGAGTVLEPHVVVRGPTRIGADNHIYQFASIGDAPQDKKYAGEPTELIIGDRNTIRESCTINRGTTQDAGVTRIGNDNWIMAYVHIAHDCVLGDHIILANNATLAGHVTVGDWAICGGFSGAHQFCNIGPHAFLGMYAGVGKDVPAYVMTMGQPATPRGINSEGLKRRGFSSEDIRHIKHGFKIIYRSQLRLEEAIAELRALEPDQPVLTPLIESIVNAERSIIR